MARMLSDADQRKALSKLLEEPDAESDEDVGSSRGPNTPLGKEPSANKQLNRFNQPMGGSPKGRGYDGFYENYEPSPVESILKLVLNDEGDPMIARQMPVLPGASSERMGRGFTDDGSSPIYKGTLQGAQGRGEVVGKRGNENKKR